MVFLISIGPPKSKQQPKNKTRLVQHEDDRRVAVPPQFVDYSPLRFVISALCDWLSPAYAVTGNPVAVYSAQGFSSSRNSDDFSVVSLGMLPPKGILLYQVTPRLLLLNS